MEKKSNDIYDTIKIRPTFNKLINDIDFLLQKNNSQNDCSIVEMEVYGKKQKHCLFTTQQTINEINEYLTKFLKTHISSLEGRKQFCEIINYIIDIISKKEQQIRYNGRQIHKNYYDTYFLNINGGDSLRTIMNFNNPKIRSIIFDSEGKNNFNLANQIIHSIKNNKEKELLKNNLYSAYVDHLISTNELDVNNFLHEFKTTEDKLSMLFQFAKTFYTGNLNNKYTNKKYEEIFLKNFLDIAKNNSLNFKEYFKNLLKNNIISSLNISRISVPLTNIIKYLIENNEKEIVKNIFDSIKEIASDTQIYAQYPIIKDSLKALHKEVSIQVLKKIDEEREMMEIENLVEQIDKELTTHNTVIEPDTSEYFRYRKTLINECGFYDESRVIIDNMINSVSNGIEYLNKAKDKTINFGKKIFANISNSINYLWGFTKKQSNNTKKSELLEKEIGNLSTCFNEINFIDVVKNSQSKSL